MKLSGRQIGILIQALRELFEYQSLSDLLSTKLERTLADYIQLPAGMNEVATVVVSAAQRENWAHQLIHEAHLARNAHPALSALHEEINAPREFEELDPFETFLLHGLRAFVDRPDLRRFLRKLNQPYEDRILLVTGKHCMGKTYTKELIYYLEDRLAQTEGKSFRTLWVDLSQDKEELTDGEPKPVTAFEIAEDIVDQIPGLEMTTKLEKMYKEERHPRWGRRFCTWLTGELAKSDTTYWLLVDGFDFSVIEEGARELIEALAERVANNLRTFRLVLLGYEEGLPHLGDRYFPEEIDDITETERCKQAILPFLLHLHMSKGDTADEEALLKKVTAEVKNILSVIDPDDPSRLKHLGAALTDKARSMLGPGP